MFFFSWCEISNILIRKYRHHDVEQMVAEICLAENSACRLVVPWAMNFNDAIPNNVGFLKE